MDAGGLAQERQNGAAPAVIDVRESDEHAQGAIPGAVHKTPRPDQETRYSRHVRIPEIGVAGQLELLGDGADTS